MKIFKKSTGILLAAALFFGIPVNAQMGTAGLPDTRKIDTSKLPTEQEIKDLISRHEFTAMISSKYPELLTVPIFFDSEDVQVDSFEISPIIGTYTLSIDASQAIETIKNVTGLQEVYVTDEVMNKAYPLTETPSSILHTTISLMTEKIDETSIDENNLDFVALDDFQMSDVTEEAAWNTIENAAYCFSSSEDEEIRMGYIPGSVEIVSLHGVGYMGDDQIIIRIDGQQYLDQYNSEYDTEFYLYPQSSPFDQIGVGQDTIDISAGITPPPMTGEEPVELPVEVVTFDGFKTVLQTTVTNEDMGLIKAYPSSIDRMLVVSIDPVKLLSRINQETDLSLQYCPAQQTYPFWVTIRIPNDTHIPQWDGGNPLYLYVNTPEEDLNERQDIFRLYNPNSGEHFYTAVERERDFLITAGWKYEGIGWVSPKLSYAPVYRLYNPNGGDHHFTRSVHERDYLTKVGWKFEGISWYSAGEDGIPLYRQYNPNAKTGSHNYTTDKRENDYLVKVGWIAEGIAWYGLK